MALDGRDYEDVLWIQLIRKNGKWRTLVKQQWIIGSHKQLVVSWLAGNC